MVIISIVVTVIITPGNIIDDVFYYSLKIFFLFWLAKFSIVMLQQT